MYIYIDIYVYTHAHVIMTKDVRSSRIVAPSRGRSVVPSGKTAKRLADHGEAFFLNVRPLLGISLNSSISWFR